MKRVLAIFAALVLMNGVTYAVVHSKQSQPRTEPVAASSGGLSAADDAEREIRALRASRSRSVTDTVASVTPSKTPRATRSIPDRVRSTHNSTRNPATRRAASAPSAGMWFRLVQCEASGHWDYGKPGHYIDRGYDFEGGPNFTHSTWVAYGGREYAEHAYDATPAQQIIIAERVLRGQGPGAWPRCSYVAGMR